VFGLKRAIDEGLVAGPRIFPSGALISQTSGHGDYRGRYEVPRGICGHLSHYELVGAVAIADGVGEVPAPVPAGARQREPRRPRGPWPRRRRRAQR
jgi:imidazolonepropionase-like amidohydrolase